MQRQAEITAEMTLGRVFSSYSFYFTCCPLACARFGLCGPTDPFTVLELQNPSQDVPELHKIIRSPECKALKL